MGELSQRTKVVRWFLLLAIPIGLLAQCVAFSARQSEPDPATNASDSHKVALSGIRRQDNRAELDVARDTFKGSWPLVVDHATLVCTQLGGRNGLGLLTVLINGQEYRLHGTAHMYPDLGAWQLDNEQFQGAKISVDDLRRAALAICLEK